MATKEKDQFSYIEDAISDFALGMNSGLEPFDLPKNQAAFLVNGTVRGNHPTNRPAYQVQNLLGAVWQTINSVGIFQGATYFAPDTGQQGLIAQIGGRLFTFTPDVNDTNVVINEVTIPGDPNPSGLPQAWLLNAERWVIINNGVNNSIYYDTGSKTSRRSVPTSTSIATTDPAPTAGQFVTPALGGTVVAPIAGANQLANFLNQAVQLVEYDQNGVQTATTSYEVVALGGSTVNYNVTLKNLGDTPGATQGAGTYLIIQPGNLGNVLGANMSSTFTAGIYSNIFLALQLSTSLPSSITIGSNVTIAGDSAWVLHQIVSPTQFIFQHPNALTLPPEPGIGDNIFMVGSTSPNTTVGQIYPAPFTAPAVGSSVPTTLALAYTAAVPQILFLNNKQYQVTAASTSTVSPANAVTLLNLNDDRPGHVFNAITSPVSTTATQIWNFPELPPGRQLAYANGRIGMALTDAVSYIFGDIVDGASGSPAYNFRDAILKTSENALLANGGIFRVPSNLGQITAMCPMAQADTSLGQGPLMIVTPGGVFSFNGPADRTQWATLTTPLVTEPLIGLGGLSQNSTIVVNGDLMFRAVDGIRSLIMAKREFYSWGQTPISFEMSRVIKNDNVTGLAYSSAAQFDNRMLMTAVPTQGPQGVYHQGLMALNFDPISSIQGKSASVYDGFWIGINVLQIIEGMFSGVHRCFAFTYSTVNSRIELYEILKTGNFDNGTIPIVWSFETPVLFKESKGKGLFDLVSLEDGEFYVKDVQPGNSVDFKVEYQPDFSGCWFPWHEFSICNSPDSTQASYGARLGLGRPVGKSTGSSSRNSNFASWFRKRYTISGHCIFMGALLKAALQPQSEFAKVISKKPVTPVLTNAFSNNRIVSAVLCTSGTLTYSGTLPRWITISGNQLVGASGYFSGESQAEADAAATAALDSFITTSQGDSTLTCSAAGSPPNWASLAWGHPVNDLNNNTATVIPEDSTPGTPFSLDVEMDASPSGTAAVDNYTDLASGLTTTYNGPGFTANIHVVIDTTATLSGDINDNYIFVSSDTDTFLNQDLTSITSGTYDFPFTVPDTGGTPINLYLGYAVILDANSSTHFIMDGTITNI